MEHWRRCFVSIDGRSRQTVPCSALLALRCFLQTYQMLRSRSSALSETCSSMKALSAC
jgi:hypothetical protein